MSPRALANQERQLQSQRLSKLGRSFTVLLATILSFATVALVMVDQLYRPAAFEIDQLKVKGKFRYFDPSSVDGLVDRNALGNFFSLDLNSIKHRVEQLAWVQSSDVRREWPNTLSIHITEHRPLMPFHKVSQLDIDESNESNFWLTSLGEVVDLPSDFELKNAISLSGNERDSELMLQQTYFWKKLIDSYGLRLTHIELSDSQAWQLKLSHLDYDFDLLLGRIDVNDRLSRFLSLFESQFKLADQQLVRVDARYPNGLAIKSMPREKSIEEEVAVVTFKQSNLTREQQTR